MRLFNTLTNKKEEFKPIEEGKVSIYICGPTVYNHAHIGNTRPMIVFDVLRRTFEYLGNDVTFVSNYTDVDDKIIKAAKAEGITEKELTDKYIKAYEDVRAGLNIEDPTYKPRVTETMPEIIDFIQALIDKGYAYEVDGDVYFRVTKVKEYGMLSGIKVEDLIAGASDRTLSEDDKKKESTTDFALWKKTDEGIQFDTPWSKGGPGWHTECVVMINKLFKDGKIDIHGGGQDLKFPHHENEIAQSMAYNGHPIANYWMHNQMINIDGEKMSKSLGNFFTVRDISREYDLEVLRFFMLSAHYRNPVNFSHDLMESAKNGLDRILTAVDNLRHLLENAKDVPMTEDEKKIIASIDDIYKKFEDSMDDDFNTADAISAIFELVKLANSNSSSDNSKEYIDTLMKKITTLTDILGLKTDKKEEMLDEDIEALIAERQQARKDKNFARADEIRDELLAKGIVLKDTREGVRWSRA